MPRKRRRRLTPFPAEHEVPVFPMALDQMAPVMRYTVVSPRPLSGAAAPRAKPGCPKKYPTLEAFLPVVQKVIRALAAQHGQLPSQKQVCKELPTSTSHFRHVLKGFGLTWEVVISIAE